MARTRIHGIKTALRPPAPDRPPHVRRRLPEATVVDEGAAGRSRLLVLPDARGGNERAALLDGDAVRPAPHVRDDQAIGARPRGAEFGPLPAHRVSGHSDGSGPEEAFDLRGGHRLPELGRHELRDEALVAEELPAVSVRLRSPADRADQGRHAVLLAGAAE